MTASYVYGLIHAVISGLLAIYCFVFADGVPNTTWFHCNFYKLHMFDIQYYALTVTVGFLLFDLILCTL